MRKLEAPTPECIGSKSGDLEEQIDRGRTDSGDACVRVRSGERRVNSRIPDLLRSILELDDGHFPSILSMSNCMMSNRIDSKMF